MREAAQQLLCAWLDSDAGSSVPSLLHALDVRRHEPEAELAVRGLQPGSHIPSQTESFLGIALCYCKALACT